MSLSEIKQLVSVAFQAGRMDAQFEMGLRSDRIRRKDAECYLASKGFEKQMIDKWVKNRLMKEYVGDSKNSPRYYSLKEINELVVSCQIKKNDYLKYTTMAENKAAKPVEGQSVEIKDYEFRLLDADEIEVRVGQGGNQKSPDWCSLLLYKDARCDMRRLDEKFGIYGWKRKHELIGQNLFCTVSVYKEGIGWIDKQDVGTPSNTEAVKGQASDSFKRACSCLGIGRELYTAPKKIFINLNRNSEYSQSGKLKTIFHVGYVGYTNRCITKLIIQDENNIVRWYCGMTEKEVLEWMNKQKEVYGYSEPAPKSEEEKDENLNEQKQYAYPQLQQAQIWEDVDKVWNGFPDLQKSEEFKRKCALRKMELAQSKKDLKAVYDAYPEYQKNAEFLAKLTQFKSRLV